MAKGLIDSMLDRIFDAKWVGRRGEKLTERELNWVRLFGRRGKVLRNLYVPKPNGETSEIDVVFITQKGIFVIESKNYSGWIFGNEKDTYWTATLSNGMKNQFYSPIKQNQTHMRWLGQYLGENIPLFSMIVFSERCELKKITVESPNVSVVKRDELYAEIREIWNHAEDCADAQQVGEIYKKLRPLIKVDKATKQKHVEDIKKNCEKYTVSDEVGQSKTYSMGDAERNGSSDGWQSVFSEEKFCQPIHEKHRECTGEKCRTQAEPEKEPVSKKYVSRQEKELICPFCGNKLVLRTAKKGTNAGHQFYGCSGYPKCKYTKNLEE